MGANNLLRREIEAALMAKYASKELQSKNEKWEIQLKFDPFEAPHHRGVYKRRIRNIRNTLQGLFLPYFRNPSDNEFLTCIKMVEYLINCRPRTRSVSEDGLPPLRPINLMVGALEPTTEC